MSRIDFREVIICVLVVIAYLAAALVLLKPIVINFDKVVGGGLGDSMLNVWIIAWDIHSILNSNIKDIYNANIFYPEKNTLAYSESMFGIALIGIPIYLLTKNYIVTYNIIVLLAYILTAFSYYILMRELIKSRIAAFIGGFVFSYNPWHIGHVSHIHVTMAFWIPICFWALIRYHRVASRFYFALFIIFFLFNALSSGHYLLIISIAIIIFEAVLLLVFLIKKRNATILYSRKNIVDGILTVVIILPILVLIYYPYLRMANDVNYRRAPAAIEKYSMKISNYFSMEPYNAIWEKIDNWQDRVINKKVIEAGRLQLIIIMIGIAVFLKRKRSYELWEVKIAILIVSFMSLVISLGMNIKLWESVSVPGLYSLLRYLPGFSLMRAPSRFALFYYFGLSLLMALVVDEIMRSKKLLKSNTIIKIGSIILLFGILLIEFLMYPVRVSKLPNNGKIPYVYEWLKLQGWGPVAEFPMGRRFATMYMYYSTLHWKPLVNGYSGYFSIQQKKLMREDIYRQMEIVSNMKVRYIIIHKEIYSDRQLGKMIDRIKKFGYKVGYEGESEIVFINDEVDG